MACLGGRVSHNFCNLVLDIEEAAQKAWNSSRNGLLVIGTGGFGSVGYPKRFPGVLGRVVAGEDGKLVVLTGASARGMDDVLAGLGVVAGRYPYMNSRVLREGIESGRVVFYDYHLGEWPGLVGSGWLHRYGGLDVAIVEAAVVGDGWFVPTGSVGAVPAWVELARWVVIEVNPDVDPGIRGVHDIYRPRPGVPIPVRGVADRVGEPVVRVPREKILAIVEGGGLDAGGVRVEPGRVERGIAENLVGFLEGEVRSGRLPRGLYPLESGVGAVNEAVFRAIGEAGFRGLRAWTEVVQDSLLDMYESGVMEALSCTSLMLSPGRLEEFYAEAGRYREGVVLRPQDVTNSIEVIRRLRVIAVNTALEIDIYGSVNSTHILGSRLVNGIGGSGDFARGAFLSVFIAPSVRKGGRISSIVPMVTHVDTPDHDVDVVVTEQGVCDLRGLSPRERAELLIERCAHPDYRDILWDYYRRARERGGHIPHILAEAFSLHQALIEHGDMRAASKR